MSDFLLKWSAFFSPLVSALVIGFGWYVAHWLNTRRDTRNRAKEKITGFLISAYRSIEQACVRGNVNGSRYQESFENAFAEIQLFGSPRQVELARKIVAEIEHGQNSDPRELLKELRAQLRSDLDLEILEVEISHFRLTPVSTPPVSTPPVSTPLVSTPLVSTSLVSTPPVSTPPK
jgi:hypothetical protein